MPLPYYKTSGNFKCLISRCLFAGHNCFMFNVILVFLYLQDVSTIPSPTPLFSTYSGEFLLGEALCLSALLDQLGHVYGDRAVVEFLCLAVQLGRVLVG